ncbi:MAG: hypothetical protein ACREB1_01820 [Sphingomicrobium sp.]
MVESDIRYYRRRACEEMAAATRAVTPAARDRRLQLVDIYLVHLKALDAPSPFEESEVAPGNQRRSAFAWPDRVRIQA